MTIERTGRPRVTMVRQTASVSGLVKERPRQVFASLNGDAKQAKLTVRCGVCGHLFYLAGTKPHLPRHRRGDNPAYRCPAS